MKASIANGVGKIVPSVAGVAGRLVYAPRTTSPIAPIAAAAANSTRAAKEIPTCDCLPCGTAPYGYVGGVVSARAYYCFAHALEFEALFIPGSFRRLLGR